MAELIDWTSSQISALYAPHPDNSNADEAAAQLTADLDATFSPDAEFYLNHERVDRDGFTAFIKGGRVTTTKTDVECKPEDLIEALVEDGNPDAGSVVAGKATIVHTHPWRIRAAPAKSRTVVIFSAKIQKSPQPQIVQLFQTSASKPFPIVLQQPKIDPSTL